MRPLSAMLTGLLLCAPASAQTAPSTQPSTVHQVPADVPSARSAFDPSRHLRVDEVREGMKGYGLSVLSGTKITKFDVEVITVLKDVFGPKQSVVMIRCVDDFMEHVGPIAGCSGSPIYLYDDSGKARLLGAYAFGWDLARDPIIGVQPIEYMLTLSKPPQPTTKAAGGNVTWSLLQSDVITTLANPPAKRDLKMAEPSAADAFQQRTANAPHLRQLMTPLSVRGMSQAQIEKLAPMLRSSGFEPMLAAGGGESDTTGVKIEPGSVMGAAMLSGDLDLAAIGTCTEVIDGRAYGFGHPFTGEGATSVPMGAGSINLVMPVLTSSFKMGSVGEVTGAIDMDGAYGIAGQIGAKATTFPIVVDLEDQSVGRHRTFHYQCAVHPAMSPMLVGMALQSSLSSEKELPRDHTIEYDVELKFEGDRTLKMTNVASSVSGDNLAQSAIWPAMLLANNPLERLNLQGVAVKATIRSNVDDAEILTATPNASTFKPGETVAVHLRLKPFRGEVFEKTVEVSLSKDLAEGDYNIAIADAPTNLQFEIQSEPHRFAVRNVDELFDTLQTVITTTRSDRMFVRLSGAEQSVSIGRTSLTKLPPSKRAILEAAARPDTAAAVQSSVQVIEMDRPISGSATMVVHVAKKLPG